MIAVEKLPLVSAGSVMKQTPIQYNLQGNDYEALSRAAQELIAVIGGLRKSPVVHRKASLSRRARVMKFSGQRF